MRNELTQFLKERKRLEQIFGRDVATSEVFDSLFKQNVLKENDTLEKFERLLMVDNYELSLNTSVTDDEKVELAELLVSEDYNPLTVMDENDIVKTLKECLDDVPRPYRSFIINYYGLFGQEKMTYKEISDKYGIALSTVKTKINTYVRWLSRRKKRPENVFN
jgi:DNA-directed RNA polymerase sigma subunit (sigma70/sigma32)